MRIAALLLLAVQMSAGCVMRPSVAATTRRTFRFPDDAFAFANETVWEYHPGGAGGREWWTKREPRPSFSLRCGPMVRAARQFFLNARFEPAASRLDAAGYERLVRAVMASDPRHDRAEPIVIPGYPNLRAFSATHAALIQGHISGVWTSQLQRGNWRMIFPFPRRHQEATMRRLRADLAAGRPPIVHVLRFPDITLNHMILIYGVEETPAQVRFAAYDPNDAMHPIVLTYDRVARLFSYPRTPYFPGGPVRAYEIYDGWLY